MYSDSPSDLRIALDERSGVCLACSNMKIVPRTCSLLIDVVPDYDLDPVRIIDGSTVRLVVQRMSLWC